jgi:hypothetical protein
VFEPGAGGKVFVERLKRVLVHLQLFTERIVEERELPPLGVECGL